MPANSHWMCCADPHAEMATEPSLGRLLSNLPGWGWAVGVKDWGQEAVGRGWRGAGVRGWTAWGKGLAPAWVGDWGLVAQVVQERG